MKPLNRIVNELSFQGSAKPDSSCQEIQTLRKIPASAPVSLQPGDIVVIRTVPSIAKFAFSGFWRHSGIYFGTISEMKEFFDDNPAVVRFYGGSFVEYLRRQYPKEFISLSKKDRECLDSGVVIEASYFGVDFATFNYFISSGYLVALRPRLEKVDIARAIEEAILHLGKPFNLRLCFKVSVAMTCTQLIYEAYKPDRNSGKKGIKFELENWLGQTTMAARQMVGHYARHIETENQSLDFVYFLKLYKGTVTSTFSESDLIQSFSHPKTFRKSDIFHHHKWWIVRSIFNLLHKHLNWC